MKLMQIQYDQVLLFFCVFLIVSTAHATEHWIADQKTGCKIKNPRPMPDESVSWEGDCKDGKAHGQGTLHWYAKGKQFLTIEGVMEEGQCRRNCTITTEAGYKYVGELQDNRPNGTGTMNYPDGTQYSGGWANGKKHGKGKFIAKDGSAQEEEWKNGKKLL
jgi:hypothetical protein